MEKSEWKLVAHSYQIADTGDYDGHYEITNGKISIFTKDDDDGALMSIVNALNDSGCEFYVDDLSYEVDCLKSQIKDMMNEIHKYQ